MTQEKYIGLENELTSFDSNGYYMGFNSHNFKNLLKDKYFKIFETSIRSNIGNGYYIDGSEIEIITPPITLNKGFATRLTNALLLGRNYVIENTPDLSHTGYSMHWNLSHNQSNFSLDTNQPTLNNQLCIPFQLFGLTPLSKGYQIRTCRNSNRYEVMGDSLTNTDQINATALLLGAYSAATETTNFKKNLFPLEIIISDNKRLKDYTTNILTCGRYSEINVHSSFKLTSKARLTQAQNVLELFYEWLNPFVYKLGERDEINNLEAFIKGDKNLEMDDLKYFKKLKNNKGICTQDGTYRPIKIRTPNGLRSPVLQVVNKDRLEVPIEGELFGLYATNNIKKNYITTSMNWKYIDLKFAPKYLLGFSLWSKRIRGVPEMIEFAKKNNNRQYQSTINTNDVVLNNISNKSISLKLNKKIIYNPSKDLSAYNRQKI